jgi:uncharacterized protein YxjI
MLDRQRFFIREQVAMLKTVDSYDILDPDTEEVIGQAREEISGLVQALRWIISKKLMPTTIVIRDADGEELFSIYRPVTFFRSQVEVRNAKGNRIGYFKSKILSLGGGFWVYDNKDRQVAEVKGDWKSWNFRFLTEDGEELGVVTKKWAGLAKALFTSADNYMVSIADDLADDETTKKLLLAAALAIDVVYYEENG